MLELSATLNLVILLYWRDYQSLCIIEKMHIFAVICVSY